MSLKLRNFIDEKVPVFNPVNEKFSFAVNFAIYVFMIIKIFIVSIIIAFCTFKYQLFPDLIPVKFLIIINL
jgi:hypothetical protein